MLEYGHTGRHHLLTLGFLGLNMVGALLQMVPVVLGVRLPAVRWVAWSGLIGMGTRAPLLAAGLAKGKSIWISLASLLLGAGLLPFLVAMLVAITRRDPATVVAWPMRQAWLALGLTGMASFSDIPALVDIHLAWGLGGWILFLVVGVAYQVVPMFQLTPPYPERVTRWLTWIMLFGLTGFGAARLELDAASGWLEFPLWVMSASAATFALLTLCCKNDDTGKWATSHCHSGALPWSAWWLSRSRCLSCMTTDSRS